MQELGRDTLIKDIPFAVVDVETTGLYHYLGDKITEIGIVRQKNGKQQTSFQSLINPQRPISRQVSSVTGITNDMVRDAPTFSEVIDKILSFFKDTVIVCHNASFDLSFIITQMKNLQLSQIDNPVVDTLILARKYFSFPSNALGKIARYLNFQHDNLHRALGDAKVTGQILDYFLNEFKKSKNIETLDDLLRIHGRTIILPETGDIPLPPLLEEAIRNRNLIKIKYLSKKGIETVREIEPIEVTRSRDYAYLIAFCNLKKEQKTFRIDRIMDISLIT